MRAARVDAKERCREALNPDGPRVRVRGGRDAGYAKGLAVQAVERGEAPAGNGGVDGGLQRGVGEGGRRDGERDGSRGVVDAEGGRPREALDGGGVDEAVRAGIRREEKLVVGAAVGGKVEGKAGKSDVRCGNE